MFSKRYFSYIRVSTARQGQHNTSLTEQQAAIDRYARTWNLNVVKSFEERETAARHNGRPVFLEMLKALKSGKADGVIIHKIDRSARNLKDWADLGALIDAGVEVLFANESIDLNSRGGRLSADIQAVIAADFIRNLREETKKGIYGRLKQGLYPFPAPLGYRDTGAGKAKALDESRAPLIRQMFELYAAGKIGLNALVAEMHARGLRSKTGGQVTRNGLAKILHNPFYCGLIEIKSTKEMFLGQHERIISKRLFDEVQDVFAGKHNKKQTRHFFVFRRLARCGECSHCLIPERQKGWVYYRCQTKKCLQKTIREELLEKPLLDDFERMQFTREEKEQFWSEVEKYHSDQTKDITSQHKQLLLERDLLQARLEKLADAYVDEVFDKETYLLKKNKLLGEIQSIKEKLENLENAEEDVLTKIEKYLELANRAYLSYKLGKQPEKREMVETIVSNLVVKGKNVIIKLKEEFQMATERAVVYSGSPYRATFRTNLSQIRGIAKKLYEYFSQNGLND